MVARIVVLIAAAVLTGAHAEPPASVTAVRFWPSHGATRIAIEVSGDFRYRMERLRRPDRVFFDVIGARPRLDRRSTSVLNVSHPLVARIRVAETQPGTTRVVLDLTQGAEVVASKLSNPDRLMIEVRTEGSAPPSALAEAHGPSLAGVRVSQMAPARTFVPPRPAPPGPAPELLSGPPLRPERQSAFLPLGIYPAIRAVPGPPQHPRKPVEMASDAAAKPVTAAPVPPPANRAPASSAGETAVASKAVTKDGDRSLIRALGLKLNRIVLDPGHGGRDQGTAGPNGLLEKDLVLDVARRLGALIEKKIGAEVVYTRDDDHFVPLEARTALANERRADLFLSLHANSSSYRSVAGIETFYLNFTDSREALEVAARENASSEKSIHELRDVIQKITLHDKAEESREFAKCIQASLYSFAARNNPAARDRGVRKAPFVVLIGAVMPSVLVEIGFVSNQRDEALLKRPEHRQKLAEALCQGLERYADGLSHFRVAKRDPKDERAAAKGTND
jgi:N-acetylmuramoyl-L-alanine amidase